VNGTVESVVLAAVLAFCRVGGCFLVMPGLSNARVPVQVRLFVAFAASGALLVYMWDVIVPAVSRDLSSLVPMIVSETLIGALIGLLARIYLMALQFIGSAMGMLIGFQAIGGSGIANGEPEGPLGELISFAALMMLFVFDFHHDVFRALARSYEVAPLGSLFDPQGALVDIGDTLRDSFLIALRLGSPFIAYAIVVNLTIGFLNKLTPQIPVYFISLPMVLAGGLLLFYLGVTTMLSLFADGFAPTVLTR
jgi:flagellar biosynthetic protein FliR